MRNPSSPDLTANAGETLRPGRTDTIALNADGVVELRGRMLGIVETTSDSFTITWAELRTDYWTATSPPSGHLGYCGRRCESARRWTSFASRWKNLAPARIGRGRRTSLFCPDDTDRMRK